MGMSAKEGLSVRNKLCGTGLKLMALQIASLRDLGKVRCGQRYSAFLPDVQTTSLVAKDFLRDHQNWV